MLQNLIRAGALALAVAAHLPVGAQTPRPKEPLKVGFVYVSPVGDAGWTYQHDLGRREMERALGAQVQTTVVASVAEGPDAERVMRDLVRQGNRLIVATSFGYLEPALRVAADHPEVRFAHAGGYKSAPNLVTYSARYYEARWLAGYLAGRTSRTGMAGYVAGFPVPEVVQGINAFTLGMRAARPGAEVRVIWLNTWFDPPREREAAQTLIDQGADVLTNHSGSPAVPQTAEANFKSRGVRVVGYQSDMRAHAPEAQLAAIVLHWGGYYTALARSVLDDRWTAAPVWGGMKDGLVTLEAVAPGVPRPVQDDLAARRADIEAGRLKPFAAPLVDTDGRERLANGTLDDGAIATMNWFVRGVVGTLPKP